MDGDMDGQARKTKNFNERERKRYEIYLDFFFSHSNFFFD